MGRLRLFRERCRTDRAFRLRVSLRSSFLVHVVYIVYKSTAAIWYRSAWFGVTAVYYMVLCAARYHLLHSASRQPANPRHDERTYRFCGGLLLVLTIAIGAVNFYTIRDHQAMRYPWHLIYGAAAYTFYSLTTALIWLIRKRGSETPLYRANKLLSLSAALVALFSLQMALLAAFGDQASWELPMNIATGSLVYLLVVVIAIHMLRGNPEKIQNESPS